MIEIIKISLICFVFVRLGEPGSIFAWYQRLIENLPWWLWKPLGGCERCCAGQVLFWYYLFFHIDYNLIEHLFYPAFGISLTLIYNKLWTHLEK